METKILLNAIALGLTIKKKEEIFTTLVDKLSLVCPQLDRYLAIKRLLEREQKIESGIGLGIAISHVSIGTIDNCLTVFGQFKNAVELVAIDNKPIYLVFLIFSPPEDQENYLKLLARLVRLLKQDGVVQQLMTARDIDEVGLLLSKERK